MKICIDPGHSGPAEPGACSGGFTEAAVNLQVALVLAKLLEKNGHKVVLTRQDDIEDDELEWRADVAYKYRTHIFVSLHCNSFKDPAANGSETWHFYSSDEGQRLARCIQNALVSHCQTADRGIKPKEDWVVLRDTYCPAVLVEMAFISNPKERELLTDKMLQRQFAVAIAQGIDDYAKESGLDGKRIKGAVTR